MNGRHVDGKVGRRSSFNSLKSTRVRFFSLQRDKSNCRERAWPALVAQLDKLLKQDFIELDYRKMRLRIDHLHARLCQRFTR